MNTILIKKAKIVDPGSSHNGKTCDVLISKGKIEKIDSEIKEKADRTIELKNLHLSPGFFDPTVHFCDPGDEHKEDINSGINAAKKGGYTSVGVLGITNPPVTEKTRVEYIVNKSKGTGVTLVPIGCVSAKHQGKELAELFDMTQSGAKGFYDGKHQLDAGLVSRALEYGKNFNTTIFSYPDDPSLSVGGLMHEGTEHIKLGLKGIPAIAEELGVIRDIYLANYHQSRLHLVNISAEGSINQLKKAKTEKIPVTAQCSVHHLYFSDADLHDFDSNLKLHPPLRSDKDRKALIEGLKSGVIDTVTSDHTPQDIEAKKMEFDLAEYGTAGLEHTFSILNTVANKELGIEKIVEILAIRSRKILGIDAPSIKVGNNADLTLFDPDLEFTIQKSESASKAWNDPYVGKSLKGKVYGIINADLTNL